MKNKKPLVIEMVIGIILASIGIFVMEEGYYATLFLAVGLGLCFASCVQLLKIYYYEMPKNKVLFEEKMNTDHINRVDERKIFLRMKTGSLVYQLMSLVLLFLSFILALLHTEAWMIAIIFGLFILQTILGAVIYKHLESKM